MIAHFLETTGGGVIFGLAIMLLAGFVMSRITNLFHLPNVTGYILAGVLIGPYLLHLIPDSMIQGMDFVTDVALSFIAFGVGKYFRLETLKRDGKKVIIITIFEALMAALVICLVMIYLFHLPVPFALILGAIGCATAPASTIMTIRQYKAKGPFIDTILQVVALDDAVALIAFSAATAAAQAIQSGRGFQAATILLPIAYNLAALAMGALAGFVMHLMLRHQNNKETALIVAVFLILLLSGACSSLSVSPLLACMVAGTVYINISHSKLVFKQINRFTPPIQVLFFVLSGLRLNVLSLKTAGVVGVVYFFIRILGKYAGASLGGLVTKSSPAITKYLGLALVPQAGVSIGLAVLGQRMLPPEYGTMLSTIILSSGVLYEMVGPACAKASMFLSGSIKRDAVPQRKQRKLAAQAAAAAVPPPDAQPASPQPPAAAPSDSGKQPVGKP